MINHEKGSYSGVGGAGGSHMDSNGDIFVADKLKEEHDRYVREITPQDIPGIRKLFRMFLRPEESRTGGINMDSHHVFHEDINNFPSNWRNPEEVRAFEESLQRFYFPPKTFEVEATKKKGEKVNVSRKTRVCIRDEEVVGVYSYLTDDPYTTDTDRDMATGKMKTQTGKPLRMAYGHVLVVDPRYRKEAIGSYLVGKVAREVFEQGYDQLTSCIDQVGDFGDVMKFVWSLGFVDDHRVSSRYSYRNLEDPEGEDIKGIRILLFKENWPSKRKEVSARIKKKWNLSTA
jgi:GNAT superfamily N-acetyltransferase